MGRHRGNGDTRTELEPVNREERHQLERSGYGEDMARNGYATIDRRSTEPYADKERPGLGRDAQYPRRW